MKINDSALVIGKLIIAWLLIALRSDSLLQDVFCFHYCAGQGRGGKAHLSSDGGTGTRNEDGRRLTERMPLYLQHLISNVLSQLPALIMSERY